MWRSVYAASWLLAAGMYGAAMLLLGHRDRFRDDDDEELGGLASCPLPGLRASCLAVLVRFQRARTAEEHHSHGEHSPFWVGA